ncbi:phosphotransferase [Paenibacillus qinlingensis]|uniref:Ser/Thr protein kinase RdoA (MazF antagonist) n=1 Tax=Paenibacillus qinlingensis TaxID=1837343 RepID=A0ABU1NTC7_9BACL|nr:phosphotransferase [Paenibacillus qinlingensis]MDR6550709.1 Ser/Thr protein kinase RdoA (MazF antagonist) [Paenibacillus qinlingensis]
MDYPFHDLQSICREYDIGDFISAEGKLGGYVNTNIKIRTKKGFFVIRIYREKFDPERIHYAHEIVSILRSFNLPALLPLKNKLGSYFSTYNDYFIEVTPFIDAHHFQWLPKQAYFSGSMLRNMHQTLLTTHKDPPTRESIYHFYNWHVLDDAPKLQLLYNWTPQHMAQIYHINNLIQKHIQHLESFPENLPTTILHGDWNPGNQLYQASGEVCCILDFDSIQRGECVFDVAYALYFFLLKDKGKFLVKPFIQGYGGLSEQEQSVLPSMIAKLGLFFGSFINKGDLAFTKQQKLVEWVLSPEGVKVLQERG